MKVLFVTHCTGMAGANRSLFQLILELRDDYDVEPYVLLPRDNSSTRTLKDNLKEHGIDFLECAIPFFKQQTYNRYTRFHYYECFKQLKEVCETLRPMHFDIVHSNSSVIDFGGYISKILGIKHIWHLRDFGDLDYGLHSIWGKRYEKATYKNGDVFVAISEAVNRHFDCVIDGNKIQIVYNGIKPNNSVPISLHANDKIQFLCAGVICEAKNQMEIIEAVDFLVHKKNVTNFHLTIVGMADENYLKKLVEYVKLCGLQNYVTFVGEIDGIEQLASTMDVGIVSSKCEAFGRVTVEYMLQNLAVIANDNGANQEIVVDGQTGLIYQHNSVESLAEKMKMLIDDKEKLMTLAANGCEDAHKRFLSSANTAAIYKIYALLMAEMPNDFVNVNKSDSVRIMTSLYLKEISLFRVRQIGSVVKSFILGR